MSDDLVIRDAHRSEYAPLGQLLVTSYSELEGFPGLDEQPSYYERMARIGDFACSPSVRLLVATSRDELVGGVVYVGDMADYGSGGSATSVRNAAGMRLLAVDSRYRGVGVGKALTRACIDAAKAAGQQEMILHTTAPMQVAWRMYERLGFKRATELDFLQDGMPVFGFRLHLGTS